MQRKVMISCAVTGSAAARGRRTIQDTKQERERNHEEDRGEPHVEAKELHAHFARDENQREDDAEAEVS